MNLHKYMVVIVGPTGVGKTDMANALAQAVSGQIVNLDMGQMYTPCSIGTAKPDWRHEPVPHHLFDILDTPVSMTVAQYHQRLQVIVQDIWSRGSIPIIVGGSTFYASSIFFPLAYDQEKSAAHKQPVKAGTHAQLMAIDPERAAQIHPNDQYRIDRALALYRERGVKPSAMIPVYNPLGNYRLIHLTRDRSDLYDRINRRVVSMLDAGWIDEVNRLQGTEWESFLKIKKLIGYDDILHYLSTGGDRKALIATIAQKTRHYAKRQEIFWRMLDRKLATARAALPDNPMTSSTVINLTITHEHAAILDEITNLKKMISNDF